MTFQTISTVLHDLQEDRTALRHAMALARSFDAHLSITVLGIDLTDPGFYYADMTPLALNQGFEDARKRAVALEKEVADDPELLGLSYDIESVALRKDSLSGFVADRARFSDLIVLPVPYGDDNASEDVAILEAALLDAQLPVLVVPKGVKFAGLPDSILVAWNESPEALSATRAAFPFLQRARQTEIAIYDPPRHGPNRSDPGGRLAQMIARHGGNATVSVMAKTEGSICALLMQRALDSNSGLVAMGAYGHSRLREAVLGGATRDMLEHTKMPVLMAH